MIVPLLFSQKCISQVNKAHYDELREENTFFHFSVKDLVKFSKKQ